MRFLPLLLLAGLAWPADEPDGPLHAWHLAADRVEGQKLRPTAGTVAGTFVGPIAFANDGPKALVLKGSRVDLGDLTKATLPRAALSVEAWVRIDRPIEWSAVLGAFQDNGAYEKGWLLGHNHGQFFFALASTGRKDLTYLKARDPLLAGSWYHVVGTYDGKEQRLYLDGRLAATSTDQKGPIDYPPKGFYTLGAYRDDNELYPLQGQLESAALFGRALSQDEVRARFDARKKLFPGVEPAAPAAVADWPTFLHDNRRSGRTDQAVPGPLRLAWSRTFRRPPAPAWPEEAKADYYHNKASWKERIDYDCAFHTIGVGDRVWLGSSSEDKVVCLDATTGLVRWQHHTEGPVRCAPTYHEGRLYFGSDDGHVYCLEAESGKQVWRTRVADSALRLPGNQRMISLWPVRTDVLIDGGKGHVCAGVFPSQGVYQATLDLATGAVTSKQTLQVTAQGYLERKFGRLMVGTGRNPAGMFLVELEKRGKEPGKEANPLKDYPFAFITAGDTHFAGGDGVVAALDKDLKPTWTAQVEGRAYGLMALRGRLYVSTDAGVVYCFSADAPDKAVEHRVPAPVAALFFEAPRLGLRTSVDFPWHRLKDAQGYALVVGGGDLPVAHDVYDLATRTRLQVVGLEADAGKAAAARAALDAAGLAGRATVHHGSLKDLPYTTGVFNVVVAPTDAPAGADLHRVARPGGFLVERTAESQVRKIALGPLVGAGTWTHQYGDVGNTACSRDDRVGSELQIQWFGKPGPRTMIDRHHRTSSPLYLDGRLFVPGEDTLTGVDAYNGTILWEKAVPDSRRVVVFRDASQLALDKESLFVAAGARCLALDPATGKEQKVFALPKLGTAPAYEWDYVATTGGLLIGSGSKKGSIRREQNHQQTLTVTHWDFGPAVGSDFVFAHDTTGKLRWTYESKAGLLINQTFTLGDGRFYFVESDNPATLASPVARHPYSVLTGKGASLVALDLATGKVVYRRPLDELKALHHNCFGVFADGKLALVGSRNDGTDKKTSRLWYDVHVYDAATGKRIWTASQNQQVPINAEHGEQERHPAIVAGTLYCEPKAYDLATGKPLEWKWPWQQKQRRGCGTLAASASAFYFRDETCQAFNLEAGKVSPVTTETRPGCWLNMIPAGGLVLVPEGSSGCTCNHSVQTSLALIPAKDVPKR